MSAARSSRQRRLSPRSECTNNAPCHPRRRSQVEARGSLPEPSLGLWNAVFQLRPPLSSASHKNHFRDTSGHISPSPRGVGRGIPNEATSILLHATEGLGLNAAQLHLPPGTSSIWSWVKYQNIQVEVGDLHSDCSRVAAAASRGSPPLPELPRLQAACGAGSYSLTNESGISVQNPHGSLSAAARWDAKLEAK